MRHRQDWRGGKGKPKQSPSKPPPVTAINPNSRPVWVQVGAESADRELMTTLLEEEMKSKGLKLDGVWTLFPSRSQFIHFIMQSDKTRNYNNARSRSYTATTKKNNKKYKMWY